MRKSTICEQYSIELIETEDPQSQPNPDKIMIKPQCNLSDPYL